MPRNSGLPPAAEISRVRDRDATGVVPMLFLPLLSEANGYYPALGGVCRGSFAQDRSKIGESIARDASSGTRHVLHVHRPVVSHSDRKSCPRHHRLFSRRAALRARRQTVSSQRHCGWLKTSNKSSAPVVDLDHNDIAAVVLQFQSQDFRLGIRAIEG